MKILHLNWKPGLEIRHEALFKREFKHSEKGFSCEQKQLGCDLPSCQEETCLAAIVVVTKLYGNLSFRLSFS